MTIPPRITRLPYDWCFRYLKRKLEKFHPRLWGRNSYRSNNLVLFLSDLDLTLISDEPLSLAQLKPLKRILKKTKRYFPFLGELNIYDRKYFFQMHSFANPLELMRDPELISFFNLIFPKPSSLHKTAFLSQMFLFDRHQIYSQPNLRTKKWRHHFELIGSPLLTQNLNHSIFLEHFISCFDDQYFDQKRLTAFFKNLLHEELSELNSQDLLQIYPQWWVSLNISDDQVMEDLEVLDLTESELSVIAEHLNWEIWGIYSQVSFEENTSDYLKHLSKLLTLCSILKLKKQEEGLLIIQKIMLEKK